MLLLKKAYSASIVLYLWMMETTKDGSDIGSFRAQRLQSVRVARYFTVR